jgi:hypothetical protein
MNKEQLRLSKLKDVDNVPIIYKRFIFKIEEKVNSIKKEDQKK